MCPSSHSSLVHPHPSFLSWLSIQSVLSITARRLSVEPSARLFPPGIFYSPFFLHLSSSSSFPSQQPLQRAASCSRALRQRSQDADVSGCPQQPQPRGLFPLNAAGKRLILRVRGGRAELEMVHAVMRTSVRGGAGADLVMFWLRCRRRREASLLFASRRRSVCLCVCVGGVPVCAEGTVSRGAHVTLCSRASWCTCVYLHVTAARR